MGQVCGRATGRGPNTPNVSVTLQQQEPELIYFDGPGRGELARAAFRHGKVTFKDTRVSMGDWPALKSNPNSAPARCFGSMPVIAHGDTMLVAQSVAVAQYAADLGINKSSPPTPEQRSLDLMVCGAHGDLQAAMYACLFGSDESKAQGKEALLGKVTPLLGGLERMYTDAGPFLYSTSATLGDLAVANAISSPFPGLKALGVSLESYPKLVACAAAVEGQQSHAAPPPRPAAEGELQLQYFNGPGRGELTRLALHAGNVAFKDTRVAMGPEWQAIKEDPNSAPAKCFGSMPVLVQGGHMVAQSMATAQYAADLGINKSKPPSAYQRALDMMVLGAHADLQAAMYKCLFGTDEGKAAGKAELPDKVKPHLEGLERLFQSSSPFIYAAEADGPTLGDLAIYNVVTSPFPGLKALQVDLDSYPQLNKCVQACKDSSARPGLKAYLSS